MKADKALRHASENVDLTVVHLDDEASERGRLQVLVPALEAALEEIYQEHFCRGHSDDRPRINLTIIQAANAEELKSKLFETDRHPHHTVSNCVLFILDYYLDTDLTPRTSIDHIVIDGIPVSHWIEGLFPALPKLLLTRASPDQVSMGSGTWHHVDKEILRDPFQFICCIQQFLSKSWEATFLRKLLDYGNYRGRNSWHTPGHNAGSAFSRSDFQRDIYSAYGRFVFSTDLSVSVDEFGDLSELDMHSTLEEARRRSAVAFGAEETLYITNGTSTSNKALLMTLLRPGEVVLLDRNCHKSVHQAVVMSGALPLYMLPRFNAHLGISQPLSWRTLQRFLGAEDYGDLKPRMLVLTTCTYEGILYPVHRIAQECDMQGILFYADEAWAPHLRFHPYYRTIDGKRVVSYAAIDGAGLPPELLGHPDYSRTAGAHFAVQSTHKALAAFSQASMIHVARRFRRLLDSNSEAWGWLRRRFASGGVGSYSRFRHDLSESLRYWHSTSPHYPMLATLDRAGIQAQLEGMKRLDLCLRRVEEFTLDLNRRCQVHGRHAVLDLEDIVGKDEAVNFDSAGYIKDPLKLLLGFPNPAACDRFKDVLRKQKIQWEKSTKRTVEFLISIGTYPDHFETLNQTILRFPAEDLGVADGEPTVEKEDADQERVFRESRLIVSPSFAASCDSELVPLAESVGQPSAQMLVPYPPGIPLFLPGLEITTAMVRAVERAIEMEGGVHSVHGLFVDGNKAACVRVVERDEVARFQREFPKLSKRISRLNQLMGQLNDLPAR